MATPVVSVICPIADRGPRLSETIESVLAQSFLDWELLLISDASTDSSDEISRSYAAHDNRIHFHRLAKHGHPGPLRTFGTNSAQGTFVAYLDHDDAYEVDHLTHLIDGAGSDRTWVVSGAIYVDDAGNATRRTVEPEHMWTPDLQICSPLFEPSRVMIRRDRANAVGAWAHGPFGLEDWDYWERLNSYGDRPRILEYPGARILEGPQTRRMTVRTEFVQPVATVPTIEHAYSLIAASYSYQRNALVHANTVDMMRWIRDEAADGKLELPSGWSPAQVLDGWETEPDFLRDESLVALHLTDGGAAVGFPLPCVREEHADLANSVFRRRHPLLLAALKE